MIFGVSVIKKIHTIHMHAAYLNAVMHGHRNRLRCGALFVKTHSIGEVPTAVFSESSLGKHDMTIKSKGAY